MPRGQKTPLQARVAELHRENSCVGRYVAWDHCPELNQISRRDNGPILRSNTTIRDCTAGAA
jgi:hypothetical protein